MKKMKNILIIVIAILMFVPLTKVSAKSNDNIKIAASNYNMYREQLELKENKDIVIDRTISQSYKFGKYATVQVDGWNINVLSTEVGSDGFHTIKFEAEEGYKIPAAPSKGDTRFAKVSVSHMSGQSYTVEGNVGILKFKPEISKFNTISNNVAPNVVYTRLVGIPEGTIENQYLKDHVFVEVRHQGIDFNSTQVYTGKTPIVNGSRTYLVKKNTDFKVYYMNQEHMKPIETQPSTTGVSFNHDDYSNRYRVIEGSKTDTTNKTLAYDTTIFNVFVYSFTKGSWVRFNSYDFYHADNTVRMPDMNHQDIVYPGMRVVSFNVQELKYKAHMANNPVWDKKDVGFDYTINTKASNFNVQWTSTGVDGGNDQYRESSLRHRQGDIYITPGYQLEYLVRFLDHDGNLLDSQKVLRGANATAPSNPNREGYTFEGWDKEFTNIQGHLDVYATYKLIEDEKPTLPEEEKYNVTFIDYDGNVLKEEIVNKGADATAPTGLEREGYKFIGWDKEFTNIQGDLVVQALYEVVEVIDPIIPEIPTTPNIPTAPVVPEVPTTPEVPTEPQRPIITTPTVNTPTVDDERTTIEDNETPLGDGDITTEDSDTTIEDNEVPLSKSIGGAWALINLICTAVTILIALILLVLKHRKEEDDEDKEEESEEKERRRWTKGFGIFVAIVSLVIFIITEDMTLPMQYTDKWTLAMAIILVVQVITFIIGYRWKDVENEEEPTNEQEG